MIRPRSQRILEALLIYKHLTTSQMLRLGLATHKPNLSEHLRELERRKLICRGKYGNLREEIWYAKPKALEVITYLDWSHTTQRPPKSDTDVLYYHRKHLTAAVIELIERMEVSDLMYEYPIITGERKVIADALIVADRPIAIEYHNRSGKGKIIEKIKRYNKALALGEPSTTLGVKKNTYVFHVFANEKLMENVKASLQYEARFLPFKELHRFKTDDGVYNKID